MRELASYIAACFWAAIAFRGKVRAVVGIIAALLAYPIVWLLGGTLEFTPRGLAWLPVWLTTSGLLALFVIAPFLLWLEQHKALEPVASSDYDPLSYVDLAKIAVRDMGWNFESRWETLDLRDCVQAACHAGVVTIEAIPDTGYIHKDRRLQYLPIKIPQQHWQDKVLRIWIEDDVTNTLDASDNWVVRIGALGKNGHNYRDPQFTKKAAVLDWLRSQGPKYRGHSEAGHQKSEERRRQRELIEAQHDPDPPNAKPAI